MSMRSARWVVVVAMAWAVADLHAQFDAFGERIYPERLQEDVELLRTTLHEAHADPYRSIAKAALDRVIDNVLRSVRTPMNAAEFADVLQPVVNAIGDAHTRIRLPDAMEERIRHEAPLLPLSVRVLEGELYVAEELKGFRSIPSGSLVISINGRSGGSIVDSLMQFTVSDGANRVFRERMLEKDLPYLLYRHIDRSNAFQIAYRAPSGKVETKQIFALTGEETTASFRPAEETMQPWHARHYAEHHTTWLTLGSFHTDSLLNAGIRPERFVEEMRRDLRQNRARVLVVDVRGASGSELAIAELVHSIYALKPYRVVQDMLVRRTAPPTHYAYCDPLDEFYSSIETNYPSTSSDEHSLRPDDDRLERLEPDEGAFDGKVYVVADGATCEAAASVVMMAKRHGRGSTVGEEVGTNAISACGGRVLRLHAPNSKLVFEVPLVRYVFDGSPKGPSDHGDLPDHQIGPNPRALASGKDAVKEALLEMIMELQ
ncbi:MAG: hypothetical protein IPH53_11065 [Flavobacteriales bacterium]|jgi:hypothetical protein|nr:hypothetical protein [Flavobacteriales bacterium]MBK9537343.1 hypothetical protein [Flavobacteriales bacterium]